MGFINDVIKEVDKTEDEKQKIGESLDFLMSLCKLKGESFKTKIEEDLKIGQIEGNTSLFLPITHILKSSADYRCIAKDGINDVPTKAAESITSMFKDTTPASIINGLGGLVTDAIKIITGSGEGTENEYTLYSCCIDGSGKLPAFVRIDMMIWCRNISSESLKSKFESALSIVFYKSALDITKVSFSEFCSLYLDVLDKGFKDISDDEKEAKILDAIKTAKNIYNELRDLDDDSENFTKEDLMNITPLKLFKLTRLV